MRFIITGGTGLIGRRLVPHLLAAGHDVRVLSRNPAGASAPAGAALHAWDALTPEGWADLIDGQTVIVNLAGQNVAHWRWTHTHRRIVLQSRLDTSRAIVQAIQVAQEKPLALLQASAVGYYGSRGEMALGESTTPGAGWRAEVVKLWEAESAAVEAQGVRRVLLRIGVVLDRDGGALPPFLLANRLFGGRLGDGQQWLPWIHQGDCAAAILHTAVDDTLSGPVNLVAPHPARNIDVMAAIRRARRWPGFIPVPGWALWLALGEMATSVLDSQRVYPSRLVEAGFSFAQPHIDAAVRDLLRG